MAACKTGKAMLVVCKSNSGKRAYCREDVCVCRARSIARRLLGMGGPKSRSGMSATRQIERFYSSICVGESFRRFGLLLGRSAVFNSPPCRLAGFRLREGGADGDSRRDMT